MRSAEVGRENAHNFFHFFIVGVQLISNATRDAYRLIVTRYMSSALVLI